jgi:hypothetical protein
MNKSIKTEDENLSSENLYDEYQEIKYKLCINNLNYSISILKYGKCEEANTEALKIFMAKRNIHSEEIALKIISDHFIKYNLPNMPKDELHELASSIKKLN